MLPISSYRSSTSVVSTLVVERSASHHAGSSTDVALPISNVVSAPVLQGTVVHHLVKQKVNNRSSRFECKHIKALADLSYVISSISFNMDSRVSSGLKDKLKQGTLDIQDLWFVMYLLKNEMSKPKAFAIINIYIQGIATRCVTDKDKVDALAFIPDQIKCKRKIMKYFHSDQCENITSLISGKLDSLVPESIKILCLYMSRKRSRVVLGKYKNMMPDNVFKNLSIFIDQTCVRRTASVLSVITRVQMMSVSSISEVQHSVMSHHTMQKISLFDYPVVKAKIRGANRKMPIKRSIKKPSDRIDEVKKQLFSGSLPLDKILCTRLLLLDKKFPLDRVNRWFRMYRDAIHKSTSISEEDKKKFIDEIEESKLACRGLGTSMRELDPEVIEMIKNVKSGNVRLSDLKHVRMRLVKEIGSDKTSKMFLVLKNSLLKKNPVLSSEINEAFSVARQRHTHELSDEDRLLIRSFIEGSVSLTELKDSCCKLESKRVSATVKSIICCYVKKSISFGVQPVHILPNLPENIRGSGRIIMACNIDHYYLLRSLRYGSLPFERLEEAARIAVSYFSPYTLFGMLLRYGYSRRELNEQEQKSFKSLLISLESEGLISVNKPVHGSQHLKSGAVSSTLQSISSSVLDMFNQYEEYVDEQDHLSLQSVSFDQRLGDMMARYGVDMGMECLSELDIYAVNELGSELPYDVDIENEELASVLCE